MRVLARRFRIAHVRGGGACLAVLVIVLTAMAAASAAAGVRDVRASACVGAQTSAGGAQFKRALLCLQNAERRKHGLRPLRIHPALRRAAARHMRDMVRRRYFGHVSPDGTDPIRRALASGYRGARGVSVRENILTWPAPLTPGEAMGRWMSSPPHRDAILRADAQDVGIALVARCTSGGGGLTAVVEFGRN